ncbi:MAG: glycosyl hydrolase family 18 protein [Butyrivibrio sp.]|nr:glycosyl hydrolase family 18 protein [Acetatifactor muris]MCM1558236.1 glycosyl hydrolase family 18 protein [Butyrivibrio sp.]
MKKALPVIIALLLIVIIGGVAFGEKLIDKYSYGKETADLDEYYGVTDAALGDADGNLAIVLQDEIIGEQAVVKGGAVYFDLNMVQTYLNDMFYVDRGERKLLFTTANDIITAVFDEKGYRDGAGNHPTEYVVCYTSDDKVYIAAEYVKRFANFSYEKFDRHLQMYTEWGVARTYIIGKDTQLRVQGGIKSPILRELAAGEKVEFLEEMETWSKVKTSDAMIGYVENKRLTNLDTEVETPVTDYVPEEYTSLSMEGKVSLGWHAIGGVGGNDTLADMVKEGRGINVIAPTWFSLKDSDGELFRSFASAKYVEKAHGYGLKVWGVWDDFNYALDTKTAVDSYQILASTTRRQEMARNMTDTALEYGLDGINIDFEELTDEARPHFNQFLRELSVLCRQNGLVLSVDDKVPLNSSNLYRLDIQGQVADYVIMMGYDEHWGGSQETGSVASIDFVTGGLDRILEHVPAEKVVNALPFYTRLWKTEGTAVTDSAIPISNVEECLKNYGKKAEDAVWDDVICQNYIEWQGESSFYQMWIEDAESLTVKLNAMRARNIGGVAVWRLGYGTKAAWELIAAYAGTAN